MIIKIINRPIWFFYLVLWFFFYLKFLIVNKMFSKNIDYRTRLTYWKLNSILFPQFVNAFVCFCRLWLNCFRESEKNRQEPVTNTEGQVNVTMSLNRTESATVRLLWRTKAIVEFRPTDFGRPIPGSGLASLLDKNHVISENQHNCDNLHRCYGRWWRLQLCPNSPSIKVLASEKYQLQSIFNLLIIWFVCSSHFPFR